ncbi:MAG: DUF167 domain-containing protein [Peptococcaceae bacterium]|jgi:uncharacterized protein (TIGR00251 family)|nr:DUF167 domain-containing protein [Peptococcaceae bacterium]MDH7524320.1 DUF167 domain-containing protein [Peptococcaceae bacterium]
MSPWKITETESGVLFSIKVQPRAARNEIGGLQGQDLKIRLTAPPTEGEANEACIRFIAEWLDVPKNAVRIIAGHTSRHKIIKAAGISKGELIRRLEMTQARSGIKFEL